MQNLNEVIVSRLNSGEKKVVISGAVGASQALILVRLWSRLKKVIAVLASDMKEAISLRDDLSFFLSGRGQNPEGQCPEGEVCLFPPLDVHPYFHLSPPPDVILNRVSLLHHLATNKHLSFVIVPLASAMRRLLPKKKFLEKTEDVTEGSFLPRDVWLKKLSSLAYQRVPLVEDPGTFAVRGGIIDLFSPAHPYPSRIDFLGDATEQIRFFDPSTQKTQNKTHGINIIPARELLIDDLPNNWNSRLKEKCDENEIPKPERDQIADFLSQGIYFNGIESFVSLFYPQNSSLFDYLPDDLVLCFADKEEWFKKFDEEINQQQSHQKSSTSIERIFAPHEIFLTRKEIEEWISLYPEINFSDLGGSPLGESPILIDPSPDLISVSMETNTLLQQKIRAKIATENALDPLVTELNQKRIMGMHLFLVAGSIAQEERLKDLLTRYKIPLASLVTETEKNNSISRALTGEEPSPFIQILSGPISSGFFWPQGGQWWITDEEIFGKKGKRISNKGHSTKPAGEVFSSFSELEPGDFIVHLDHGIGLYRGLETMTIQRVKNDFLLLEYLGGDRLYLPVDRLNRVCRYSASEEAHPLLDKLGGSSWQKVRDKVKTATRRLARQLLEIQAQRQVQKGHAFSSRDPLFEEFEATFPFEETQDQLMAIEEVLKDMEKERPMDRLVCGDVGYGKTEVAIRAAFKAIEDRKQTIILVPTTVLAFQHFENFKKRMKDYPIVIEMLSRFRNPKEQKGILKDLKEGKIDIVIGTHRLLQPDVKIANLGLLVIDEEHRFGVHQKEKIKQLKQMVDVVTLTATPIPRTLNFSMVGIRDLSLINTPPADRLSIRTYTTYFDEGVLREAMTNEIRRGGQIYFVHNRVASIEAMKERIQKIIPEMRIGLAHGQLPEEALEEVMIGFMEKKFDLLLCTTIIESGLDIPSANTMIINRADHMGLAQLYQLRGRVGRSNHRAYCYLIIPHDSLVTDKAKKRLNVIQKFTELGSGFKIASHDLEIRGAGNILGPEQSGHIAAIGYDLYVSLLKQAVDELKGENIEEEIDPELKLDISAIIPKEFVPDAPLRLSLYKQLSLVDHEEHLASLHDEWTDRFGPLPDTVKNLIDLIRVKIRARRLKISSVAHKNGQFIFDLHPKSLVPTEYFLNKVKKEPKKFKILPEGKFIIREKTGSTEGVIPKIITFLTEMEKAI